MVLGANQAEKNRPIIPQWTVSGHQSDDWIETTLLLNVRTEPFQVEIRLLDGIDSRADVEIDDIAFSSCGKLFFATNQIRKWSVIVKKVAKTHP